MQRKQIELANLYGVNSFCFYFYWFAGKTLLELPVRNFLHDDTLDLSFCLCWANENWTRRWDGLDSEILIKQDHSEEDDIAFINHIAPYLKDKRYIRIDDRPLLLVYRPELLPDPTKTSHRWRVWCRENGIGEIYLAYTQSFESVDPDTFGFDAAIEFPPNNSGISTLSKNMFEISREFSGGILDWSELAERSNNYSEPGYRLFRGLCPSWDNTARRGNNGTILVNNSPAAFELWAKNAIADTRHRFDNSDERLIFVNAWNEWAEGCHLEPDQKYGYAWLQALRSALESKACGAADRIVVVSHDAHPHGAQLLSLNLCRTLRSSFRKQVDLVLLGDGPLRPTI